jgi:hypothetical protein
MDFTTKNGCYSKELANGLENISNWFEDKNVSREQYIENVLVLIAPAYIKATAYRTFEYRLKRMRTKTEICTYCYNTFLKGCGLGVC